MPRDPRVSPIDDPPPAHPAMQPPPPPPGYRGSKVERKRARQANVAIAACVAGGLLAAGLALAYDTDTESYIGNAYDYPTAVVQSVGDVTLDELTSHPARYAGHTVTVLGIAERDVQAGRPFVIEDTDPQLPDEVLVMGAEGVGAVQLGDTVEVRGRVELLAWDDRRLAGHGYDTGGYTQGVPVLVAERAGHRKE
ncbi:MAG: hypothetical protein R3F65_28195 [bacterium]